MFLLKPCSRRPRAMMPTMDEHARNIAQLVVNQEIWHTRPKVIVKTREAMEKKRLDTGSLIADAPWRLLDKPASASPSWSTTSAGCPHPSASGGSATCADEAGASAYANTGSPAKAKHKLICAICEVEAKFPSEFLLADREPDQGKWLGWCKECAIKQELIVPSKTADLDLVFKRTVRAAWRNRNPSNVGSIIRAQVYKAMFTTVEQEHQGRTRSHVRKAVQQRLTGKWPRRAWGRTSWRTRSRQPPS